MKKKILVLLMMLALTPAVFAEGWGVGLRGGFAQNDPKDMKETYDEAFLYGVSSKEMERSYAVFGVEGLYEWALQDQANKLGLKLGLDIYGQNELKLDGSFLKVTETTYAIPLTVYFKRDNGLKNWSWFAGAGLTWIHTELEFKGVLSETESKGKIFPHITAGAEYRFSQLFALGLDLKYNIAAKVKKNGDILSDRSGIGGAVTARFYF